MRTGVEVGGQKNPCIPRKNWQSPYRKDSDGFLMGIVAFENAQVNGSVTAIPQ